MGHRQPYAAQAPTFRRPDRLVIVEAHRDPTGRPATGVGRIDPVLGVNVGSDYRVVTVDRDSVVRDGVVRRGEPGETGQQQALMSAGVIIVAGPSPTDSKSQRTVSVKTSNTPSKFFSSGMVAYFASSSMIAKRSSAAPIVAPIPTGGHCVGGAHASSFDRSHDDVTKARANIRRHPGNRHTVAW